jgi:hypothetical protein
MPRRKKAVVAETARPLSEVDALEVWLVLDLMKHSPEDVGLRRRAGDLVYRLRREGKLERAAG